jgi:hypothetical protein
LDDIESVQLSNGLNLPYVEQGDQSGVPVVFRTPTPTSGGPSSACSRIYVDGIIG